MSSTIQLAKGFNPKLLNFPVMVSEKLDGVPVLMEFEGHKGELYYTVRTRQNKPVPSVMGQVQALAGALKKEIVTNFNLKIVAEVTHEDKLSFKDTSGHVRRKYQNDALILNIFDGVLESGEQRGFSNRIRCIERVIRGLGESPGWCMIEQFMCMDEDHMNVVVKAIVEKVGAEGAVVRSTTEFWQPGKRTWGYQKVVHDPMIELEVHNYEQAEDMAGNPMPLVGRINCHYKDGHTGVGPGKMTHAERRALWAIYGTDPVPSGTIITVKHKRDDSYSKLRQPTFQHFRPERFAPSTEAG